MLVLGLLVWVVGCLASGAVCWGAELPRITEFSVASPRTCCTGGNSLAAGPDGQIWFALSSGLVGKVNFAGRSMTWPLGFIPNAIAGGPDGNLWVTGPGVIARVSTAGAITRFSAGLSPNSDPFGITSGPDGNLWFTEYVEPGGQSHDPGLENYSRNGVGYISPASGAISELPAIHGAEGLTTLIREGRSLWFLAYGAIGKFSTAGDLQVFRLRQTDAPLGDLTAGPQHSAWLTDDAIVRVDSVGRTKCFGLPLPAYTAVQGITAGPDGALWIAEQNRARIGRMTPSGRFTEYAKGMRRGISAQAITRGPRDTHWFVAQNSNSGRRWIGRIVLPPPRRTRDPRAVP